jgi:hypothetical protein
MRRIFRINAPVQVESSALYSLYETTLRGFTRSQEKTRISVRARLCQGLYGCLYVLAEGKIKTRYVVQPGNNRGIRLVELASLRAYIESFPAEAPAA